MTLTLTIGNVARLDNGMPTEFVLSRRGAVVGRAASCDWSLPDPRNHISSRHFEIVFDGSGYILTDVSTNGTYLNGASVRLPAPHRIAHGDIVQIGHYEIAARLSGDSASTATEAAALPASSEWRGWDDGFTAKSDSVPVPDPYAATGYGASVAQHWDSTPAPTSSVSSGRWQPQIGPGLARPERHRSPTPLAAPPSTGGGWHATQATPDTPVASAWNAHAPAADPASDWSSAAPDRPAAPSPDDVWGRIAEGNVVDWARGGFGQPIEAPSDPLGLSRPPARDALPAAVPQMTPSGWDAPPSAPAPSAPTPSPPATPPAHPAPSAQAPQPANIDAFLSQTGLRNDQVTDAPAVVLERGGRLLRRLVAGLVVMVEARARAKAQLGGGDDRLHTRRQ